MGHTVGEDIRSLRKTRGLTLAQLAADVGRSIGWLSQIERGQTTPSVRDLGQLAERLEVSISFFFRSAARAPEEQGLVLRAADQPTIGSDATGLTEELLSPTLSGSFEMIRSTFAPGAASEGRQTPRPSEDGGVLVAGTLCLTIAGTEVTLMPGDSFQFREQPYSWRNPGAVPAVVIWVISPPIY